MNSWLDIDPKTEIEISPGIDKLRLLLAVNIENLNEDELKMLFIAPYLLDFGFKHTLSHYRVFTQRHLTLQTEHVEGSGKVGWSQQANNPQKSLFSFFRNTTRENIRK